MDSRQTRYRKQRKPRFGEFTLILMPNEQAEPVQVRLHIAPVLFGICLFALLTVGTALMAANRLKPVDSSDFSRQTEASLELVSAEIASLLRSADQFNQTVERTVAQFGTPLQHSGSPGSGMNDIILSDNPEDLPRIAAQIDRARESVLNVERLFGLNEQLLKLIPNAWPLPNRRGIVTMEYGPNIHPFTRQVYLHKGFDVAEPRPGAPILAIADGVVEKAASAVDYGRHVWIRHRFGFRTLYAHMNTVLVAEGDRVSQGDTIGSLGTTGLSTGPHLHLELWMENQLLDPAPFLAISNEFNRRPSR